MAESHITSIIVRVSSGVFDTLYSTLVQVTDIEIAASNKTQGKIIVVIDAPSSGHIQNHIDQIKNFRGVMSVELVYHHVENLDEPEEESNEAV